MRIEDTNGEEIISLEDWAKIFDTPQRKKHWKAGRSAHSIADFILNRGGEKRIAKLLERVVPEEVVLEKAIPEFEVRFDQFGRGRVHDLGVFGKTHSDKSIFIGIESKVDESFNRTVSEVYLEAKAKQIAGEATNAPARIENLLRLNFYNIEKSQPQCQSILDACINNGLTRIITAEALLNDPVAVLLKESDSAYDNERIVEQMSKVPIHGEAMIVQEIVESAGVGT